MDFSKFDEQVNLDQLKADAAEAAKNGVGDYPEVEDGEYIVKVESMELGETKDGRPMFKAMFRITEGDFNKQCLFMNRVVYGTKNDASMIGSVIGFLQNLDSEVQPIVFESYSQLADLILDIMEDIDGVLEYKVEYKKDAFNNVSIKEVYEVE